MMRHSPKPSRRALTLTEVLIVVTLLGAMATGAVPSVQLILSHAESEDARERLRTSWQLALALARAQQRPVLWQLTATPETAQIKILSAENEILSSASLHCRNLRREGSGTTRHSISYVLYPHGLTDELTLRWDSDRGEQRVHLGQSDTSDPKEPGS